ncbi:MAG: cellulose biosynthesis protein BcsS [Xanthobacteraceae bacterium]
MGALRGAVAMVVAVAGMVASATVDRADAGGPDDPSLLLFSGTDLWRYGAFLYGGVLWAPDGLDNNGFIGKVLLDGGEYSYVSGDLNETIDGTKLSAAVLPGWRFIRDGLTVSLFTGPVVQDYRLTPYDPGSRLHGLYAGAEFASDIWYQPNATTMAALNGSITSIGPTGYVRATFAFRFLTPAFVGPEIAEIWCGDFQQMEFGAQITGPRINTVEWSMGSGFALTSDQRYGPYLRLGFDARY